MPQPCNLPREPEPAPPVIRSWGECDRIVGQIRAIDIAVRVEKDKHDKAIARLDEHTRETLDRLAADRAPLAQAVEGFCTAARKDFGKAKSKQLDNGRVGWRAAPPKLALLTRAKSWKTVLAKVLQAGKRFAHWIRSEPVLAKDLALADAKAGKVDADTLHALDLKLVGGTDQFSISTDTATIRDRSADA